MVICMKILFIFNDCLNAQSILRWKFHCEKPFTELHIRLDENDNPLPELQPNNQIDRIAIHHDINHRKADEGIGTWRGADEIM